MKIGGHTGIEVFEPDAANFPKFFNLRIPEPDPILATALGLGGFGDSCNVKR